MSLFSEQYNEESEILDCKGCGGRTHETVRLFTKPIPLCSKCLREITWRGMEAGVLKHWNTEKIPSKFRSSD